MRSGGGIEFGDASWYAADVLREARMAGVNCPNALAVADRLGLPVRGIARGATDCPGELSFDRYGRPVLRVWFDLQPQLLQFVVGLLLGHWCLGARKLVRVDERAWSRRFAGALLAPDRSIWSAWLESSDILDLCRRFPLVPSTTLMIRLREAGVGRVFLFDVHDDQMHPTLGDEDPLTPAICGAAANAFLYGRTVRPGIRAARLPDDRSRVAVVLSSAA